MLLLHIGILAFQIICARVRGASHHWRRGMESRRVQLRATSTVEPSCKATAAHSCMRFSTAATASTHIGTNARTRFCAQPSQPHVNPSPMQPPPLQERN